MRVAPRPKNIAPSASSLISSSSITSSTAASKTTSTPTFCYNLAQSFQSSSLNYQNKQNNTINTKNNSAKFKDLSHPIGNDISFMTATSLDNSTATVCSETSLKSSPYNPFLAKRPQSLNQLKCDRYLMRKQPPPPPPPPPQPSHSLLSGSASLKSTQSIPNGSDSMAMSHATAATQSLAMCTPIDKKFNSLKPNINARKTLQFYSLRLNKCKRHQSLTNTINNQKFLVIDNKTINTNTLPYHKKIDTYHNRRQLYRSYDAGQEPTSATTIGQLISFHEQPLYENLVNSTLEHSDGTRLAGVLDEFYVDANDANSIYRSDSGISNSSYECVTPVPAPRNNPRNCQSAPVYVNLPSSSTSSMVRGVSVLLSNRNRRRASINSVKCTNKNNKMDNKFNEV